MVVARAAVLAGVRTALVDVGLASLAAVSRQAVADELVHAVLASAAVHTGIARALVHVAQTPGVVVAARAFAPIAVYHVDATAAVRARIAGALVNVGLAVLAGEAGLARAGVPGRRDIVSTENGRVRLVEC